MLSCIPFVERLISANEHRVSNTISEFLTLWCGGILVAALCAVLLFGMVHAVWRSLWTIVLMNWHTKGSIPKACMAYEQVHSWVKENPKFQDGKRFLASEEPSKNGFTDSGIEQTVLMISRRSRQKVLSVMYPPLSPV